MIIQFPNGSAIDSSVIASIHVQQARTDNYATKAQIVVHVHKGGDDLLPLFGAMRQRGVSHFMSVEMPSDEAAVAECKKLVAKWAGLPEEPPKAEPKLSVVRTDVD